MRPLSLLIVSAAFFALAGCGSSSSAEKGYTKDDFAKRPPPPGYGPPTGAAPGGPGETKTSGDGK